MRNTPVNVGRGSDEGIIIACLPYKSPVEGFYIAFNSDCTLQTGDDEQTELVRQKNKKKRRRKNREVNLYILYPSTTT